jgi:hypothetical protein
MRDAEVLLYGMWPQAAAHSNEEERNVMRQELRLEDDMSDDEAREPSQLEEEQKMVPDLPHNAPTTECEGTLFLIAAESLCSTRPRPAATPATGGIRQRSVEDKSKEKHNLTKSNRRMI